MKPLFLLAVIPSVALANVPQTDQKIELTVTQGVTLTQGLTKCAITKSPALALAAGSAFMAPLLLPLVGLYAAGEYTLCVLDQTEDKRVDITPAVNQAIKKATTAIDGVAKTSLDQLQGQKESIEKAAEEATEKVREIGKDTSVHIKATSDKALNDVYTEIDLLRKSKILIEEEVTTIDEATQKLKRDDTVQIDKAIPPPVPLKKKVKN